jgi:hypothetical protein
MCVVCAVATELAVLAAMEYHLVNNTIRVVCAVEMEAHVMTLARKFPAVLNVQVFQLVDGARKTVNAINWRT